MARLRAADVLAARRRGGHPPDLPARPLPGPLRGAGRRRLQLGSRGRGRRSSPRRSPGSGSAGSRSARGRTLWLLAAGSARPLLVSCFWRPIEMLGTHLTTCGEARSSTRCSRPPIVLLFRRAVDLDRFLVVFVGWAVAAGALGGADVLRDRRRPGGAAARASARCRFSATRTTASFTGAALAVGLAAIALGARRRLAVAAVIGGGARRDHRRVGLRVPRDDPRCRRRSSSCPAPRHPRRSGGCSRSAAILVVVGSGVFVLRGSDVSNYLSFLGVSHRRPPTDTAACRPARSGRCCSGSAGRCGRTTRCSGSASTGRTPISSRTSRREARFPNQPAQAYPSDRNPWGVQNC